MHQNFWNYLLRTAVPLKLFWEKNYENNSFDIYIRNFIQIEAKGCLLFHNGFKDFVKNL